jgi:predicted LPLAT superfamily acyltransferase
MAVKAQAHRRRNPGPSWGFGFVRWAARKWPHWLFRPVLAAGTWVAVAAMAQERAHSREYLSIVLGRRAGLRDIWKHFFALAEFLVLQLEVGSGAEIRCAIEPANRVAFEALLDSGGPALFGTFHFGASDLLGYLLGDRVGRVSILRQQVDNSDDTRLLGQRYSDRVSFLWINDPENLVFDLKAAIEAGNSIALKCDRLEFSARNEPFRFLGENRLFPFTIYSLAMMFNRPVVFCNAVPVGSGRELSLLASPVFTPDPAAGREANTDAARSHFQAVVSQLETLVRQHPMLWFNFLPLNPAAPARDL